MHNWPWLYVMLYDSEVRVEGLQTMDYLDNLCKKERFTEQWDANNFEAKVNLKVCVWGHFFSNVTVAKSCLEINKWTTNTSYGEVDSNLQCVLVYSLYYTIGSNVYSFRVALLELLTRGG